MIEETLKSQIAEKIFPFDLYLSGKFNHNDVISAMVTMAELFESFHAEAIARYHDIKEIKHGSNLNDHS